MIVVVATISIFDIAGCLAMTDENNSHSPDINFDLRELRSSGDISIFFSSVLVANQYQYTPFLLNMIGFEYLGTNENADSDPSS